jgi:alginate O-acetyltransferase complex protein AlgI
LLGYSMQIFADFAGYSLIAIGIARLFGYNLPINFLFPYISTSITEFWRRWHISLSSFLRDYLYIPLGGNRIGTFRTYLNLMVVMILGGAWHGAAISYIVWGSMHGIGLALERPFLKTRYFKSQLLAVVTFRWLITFSFASFCWLFFKLPDFDQAVLYITSMVTRFDVKSNIDRNLLIAIYSTPVIFYHLYFILKERGLTLRHWTRSFYYAIMLFFIIFNYGPAKTFVYFQF